MFRGQNSLGSMFREPFILPSVSKINWDDLNDYDVSLYSSVLDELSLEIFYDVFNCSDSNCKHRGIVIVWKNFMLILLNARN